MSLPPVENPNAASELNALKQEHPKLLHIVKLDVTDWEKHAETVREVESIVGTENGLNLLINNAGFLPPQKSLEQLTPEAMVEAYKINCIAPILLTRAFVPLLRTAAAKAEKHMSINGGSVVEMSTAVASIAENEGGGNYPYRCSKTGLNMGMKNLSLDLEKDGILVLAMHPGWVKTDMGGPNAMISTQECVATMLDTLDKMGKENHGSLLRYNNTPIKW